MTERYEVTSQLQREFVNDPESLRDSGSGKRAGTCRTRAQHSSRDEGGRRDTAAASGVVLRYR